MRKLFSWYANSISRKIHPIEVAAIFHQKFECIDHSRMVMVELVEQFLISY
jgi:hypothetical protein